MRKSLNITVLAAMLTQTAFAQHDTILIQPVPCPEGEWELAFSDEFEGDRLNTADWITWYPYTDDGSDQCAFCRTHGNEGQVFLDENVVVSGGLLKIIAIKEKAVWMGEEREHTSGMIHSRRAFGHGKYEFRCRLPEGNGYWPALWTFGQISAEIDLMEAGMQRPKRFHTSVHNWKIKKMAHKRHRLKTSLSDDFHVFTMEWEPNIIHFYIDGSEVWQLHRFTNRRGKNLRKCPVRPGRYRTQPVFPPENEKLYIIAGLGIGTEKTPFTKLPGPETVFPNQMEIDYFRYYVRRNHH